jgi:PAS domain S-box-containing protein
MIFKKRKIKNIYKENQELVERLSYDKKYIEELTDFLPIPFCSVDTSYLIIEANKKLTDFTGYSKKELVGRKIEFLFSDKNETEFLEKSILKSNEKNKENTAISTRDGKNVSVSLSVIPLLDSDGLILKHLLFFSDIGTEKFKERLEKKVKEKTKQLESRNKDIEDSRKALLNILEETDDLYKKSEEEKNKTSAIIESFTDALLVFNKLNFLETVNPKAEHFLKIKSKDVIGKNINELKKTKELSSLISLILKPSSIKEDEKKEILTEEGKTFEVSITPIINNRQKIGKLVLLHDISREKRIEAMKSEFVSIAAHQLRTPLSAIKWTIKMLMDGDFGKLNKNQLDLVKKTYISNERMVNLINDLLNVTKIEEGKYLYKPEIVHLEDIITPLIEAYETEAIRRKLNIKFSFPKKKTSTIAADLEKMKLAIQNLLDNAIKYTPKNGNVSLKLKEENKKVVVVITDSGVGIPKDQKERIFTKFYRAANVVKMETEGSGLGLFISKNIINSHGGEIWFTSEEGRGSSFSFKLPTTEKKNLDTFIKKL